MKPKIIIICGPTGIGKTSTAIELAKAFNGRIISADSMQVYRYMDIGTAKPTDAEKEAITHYLVDVVDPDEPFDAARFSEMAGEKIKDLHGKGIVPFITGGTGLYIKALLHGLSRARPADPAILERLTMEVEMNGSAFLHSRLKKCDPEAAGKIHPNDTFRIIRALEIFEMTGKPISNFNQEHGFKDNFYHALKICLELDREVLYDRINKRVESMISQGLLDEVKTLLAKGYHQDLKSMQSIGYRHMTGFLNRGIHWEETIETLKRDTRRYAKRQLTWFRADPEIKWFEPGQKEKLKAIIKDFLKAD